jgi:hypothetical protein
MTPDPECGTSLAQGGLLLCLVDLQGVYELAIGSIHHDRGGDDGGDLPQLLQRADIVFIVQRPGC